MLDASAPAGFRLHRLELFNWGTFDSTNGKVHVVEPGGTTTLLIGQNGSGKSTLVDALLTLFVRPVVRNYNVAAGANKTERDERTYIKGAYDRRSRDEDNRAEVKYLRPDGKHYSVLLAYFANDAGQSFSVAQILFLGADGGLSKIYCFAPAERSIAEHCANLATADRVRRELERRGFRATERYTEYLGWLEKTTGIRPKAMDMFNQTVAVKDIQSLNRFIREHMLETTRWLDKIEGLQTHFVQLTEAHQSLLRVRRQEELLSPIFEKGGRYRQEAAAFDHAKLLSDASAAFFRVKIVELLGPAAEALELEIGRLGQTCDRLKGEMDNIQEQIRVLRNELEMAGGERLRQIPLLINTHEAELRFKREWHDRFVNALQQAGVKELVRSETDLQRLRERLPAVLAEVVSAADQLEKDLQASTLERADAVRDRDEAARELTALGARTTKLPESHAEVRRQLCGGLGLQEDDLPFAAELIAVSPKARAWEASIEMVLRPLALSLLVPHRHYALVSAYIDRNRLRDARNRGQRLEYLRVGERTSRSRPALGAQSLVYKVDLKQGHLLTPWVKGELEDRFNYLCCETIEQFQSAPDFAVTRERHVKARGRHIKDDRDRTIDPGAFVLGWDNKDKRKYLSEVIASQTARISAMQSEMEARRRDVAAATSRRLAIEHLATVSSFSDIDYLTELREIEALRRERAALENADDGIKVIKNKLSEAEQLLSERDKERNDVVAQRAGTQKDFDAARKQCEDAHREIDSMAATGDLERYQTAFAELEALAIPPLTPDDVGQRERGFRDDRQAEVERLRQNLEPTRNELIKLMTKYLQEYREERKDREATVDYLDDYVRDFERIQQEDLPRHERRFKERLNEKVTQEIGLLNGAFQTERAGIRQKIDQLNLSLKQLEYRPGTHMKLVPRDVRDPEIQDFQASLKECLSGAFEGTAAADEARYLRIVKLIERLRDETRWCDKVTDVRRWFDFAAVEIETASGEERSYYQDSTGQSGGEKAKLAFTILVAAIAYQYDIDPAHPDSHRFHFVVVDEMFSKVDDQHAQYALRLFRQFGLQLLIVAPLDAKARVTEPYVECYLHVVKDPKTSLSEIFTMTAREFEEAALDLESHHATEAT